MLSEGQEILEGRFKIIKRLGSGAFGEIFKVEKKKTGEFYAAKIVSNPLFLSASPTYGRATSGGVPVCSDSQFDSERDNGVMA